MENVTLICHDTDGNNWPEPFDALPLEVQGDIHFDIQEGCYTVSEAMERSLPCELARLKGYVSTAYSFELKG